MIKTMDYIHNWIIINTKLFTQKANNLSFCLFTQTPLTIVWLNHTQFQKKQIW